MTKQQIEKMFNVRIVDDSYFNSVSCKYVKAYKIYSADGCCWEKGLRTLKAVKAECEQWQTALSNIAEVRG